MRVLFVGSGNKRDGVGTVVGNQAQSLREAGVAVDFYPIVGKGAWSYLGNVPRLRRLLKGSAYDVVHAHYSYSAYVATLAGARPLVVSLMGSDAQVGAAGRQCIRLLSRYRWHTTIVKSAGMKDRLGLPHARVIPNGVSLQRFGRIERSSAVAAVGFPPGERHVIFAADPARAEKDFTLAEAAFRLVRHPGAKLHVVHDVPHERMPLYMAAADVLLLTSRYEGSPNVIKEAMAAGLPIVSTKVGDVGEIVGDTDGCQVVSGRDPRQLAEALEWALAFGRRTDGKQRVGWLDIGAVAARLIELYEAAASWSRQVATSATSRTTAHV